MTDQHSSTAKRVLFFDQIKALMIALVIAVHVFLAFLGDWIGVHIAISGSPHPFFVGVAVWVISFSNTFFMCMLFLLSGYFVPRSVHKIGCVAVPERSPPATWLALCGRHAVDQQCFGALRPSLSCKSFGDIALERHALEPRDGAVVSARAVCF